MEHKEIVERFIKAKTVDFEAVGRLMTEFGPELAQSEDGIYGVVIGKPFILNCFMPVDDLTKLVGDVRGLRNLRSVMGE